MGMKNKKIQYLVAIRDGLDQVRVEKAWNAKQYKWSRDAAARPHCRAQLKRLKERADAGLPLFEDGDE